MSRINKTDLTNLGEYIKCQQDPQYFIFKYCLTKDEHDRSSNSGKKHFPQTEYLKFLIEQYHTKDLILVAKSRQMMVTWIYSALLLWTLLFKESQLIIVQCLKEERADQHLRDKIFYMWVNLPEWMKSQLYCTYKKNQIDRWDINREVTISRVLAVQQGENSVRQFTASVIFSDEMAMQDEAEMAYAASIPSIDGGGKYVGVSTPNYQNFFYRLWWDENSGWYQVGTGLKVKQNKNGFEAVYLHYTADPKKDGTWFLKNRPKYTDDAWEREQEINFAVQAGLKYFPEYRQEIHERTGLQPIEGTPLLRSFDPGYRRAGCTVSQLNSKGEWIVLAEFLSKDSPFRDFALHVKKRCSEMFPKFHQRERRDDESDYIDYIDFAGRQVSSKSDKTDIQILNDLFIYPISSKQGKTIGFKIMRECLRKHEFPEFFIDPNTCPLLVEGFRGAFHFKKDIEGKVPEEQYASDNDCIHLMDTLKYVAMNNPDLSRLITPEFRPKKKKFEDMTLEEKISYWHRNGRRSDVSGAKFRRIQNFSGNL